jgi:hypothetical protein
MGGNKKFIMIELELKYKAQLKIKIHGQIRLLESFSHTRAKPYSGEVSVVVGVSRGV